MGGGGLIVGQGWIEIVFGSRGPLRVTMWGTCVWYGQVMGWGLERARVKEILYKGCNKSNNLYPRRTIPFSWRVEVDVNFISTHSILSTQPHPATLSLNSYNGNHNHHRREDIIKVRIKIKVVNYTLIKNIIDFK